MAGGAVAIARASGEHGHQKLTPQAVWKWIVRPTGIPEQHWRILMAMRKGEITPDMLHQANELARTLGGPYR